MCNYYLFIVLVIFIIITIIPIIVYNHINF